MKGKWLGDRSREATRKAEGGGDDGAPLCSGVVLRSVLKIILMFTWYLVILERCLGRVREGFKEERERNWFVRYRRLGW